MNRIPDGTSNIVPARSHLNRILVGDERGLTQSLKNFYDRGIQKPTRQAEKPFLRIVLSASPEYFRPADPEAIGTWDEDRLAAWLEATMAQLREEHGDDLVFAELHLDEDTPHVHAVVAPTYTRKARKPGKRKRDETANQFEARKAAALESEGVRTVGRASHHTLSKLGSFQRLRERMSVAMDHLGIEYGEDRAIDAPPGKSTREWVSEQAAKLRAEKAQLDKDRTALAEEQQKLAVEKQAHDVKVEEANKKIDFEWDLVQEELSIYKEKREDLLQDREEFEAEKQAEAASQAKTAEWIERGVNNLRVAIDRVQNGTYDTEITASGMADKPRAFDALRDAAPDKRPTFGFRARFWSLNFSDGSGPAPLPERIRTSLGAAFDRVGAWAVEVRKGRLEAEAVAREAVEARKEAKALRATLEPLRAAVEAVEAWEAEKARNEWWDMTPEARLAAKRAERKAAIWANVSDDGLKVIEAEISQLEAETGTIIRVESLDPEIGYITGENLLTGEQIAARIILDENERVQHYPNKNVTGQEVQQRVAQRALRTIRDQIANVVAGSIVFLAGLKTAGSEKIVAGVPTCQPHRLDPRSTPPPVEANPLLDLPADTQTKVRQALGTSSTQSHDF